MTELFCPVNFGVRLNEPRWRLKAMERMRYVMNIVGLDLSQQAWHDASNATQRYGGISGCAD